MSERFTPEEGWEYIRRLEACGDKPYMGVEGVWGIIYQSKHFRRPVRYKEKAELAIKGAEHRQAQRLKKVEAQRAKADIKAEALKVLRAQKSRRP